LCGQAIERAQLFEATRAAERRVSALAEASHAFSAASLSPAAICDTAVHQASASLGDAAAIVLLTNDQRLEVPAVWHPDPAALAALQALLGSLPPDRTVNDTVAGRVVLADQAVVLNDVQLESTRASLPIGLRPYVQQFEIGRVLAVPLRVQGRPIGALVVSRSRAGAAYSDEDRAFALDLASHAALAIDNAQAYDRATDAIRARDEFLSIASHELRTPVAAISAVAQLMHRTRQRGDLDEARLDRALARLTQTSGRLVSLTEDLLDVSRLQTGHFELRLKPIDVGTFVGDLVDQWTAQVTDRHTLSFRASAEQFVVQADPARMEQVVGNVLSNALKYSPDGGPIAVSVGRDGNGVQLEVQDQGIGLPAGAAETIFRPFGRALNAVERQIQGLGLGLYICRQIVERHDGRIWAGSPGEGAGTTVYLWLPHTTPAT
jgi:signal transduction histidine kinase